MIRLKDIFGQDDAVDALRQAHRTDRLAHGLIFSGPAGIGKSTTATALAALFLCQNPQKDDSCGKCQSCQAMSSKMHPDFHVITKELARVHDRRGTSKATQLSIEVIRLELNAAAGRKTTLGQGKVFVIEEAELMTTAAQNAMLKTLEEPLGRTLIVLITSHLSDLLATIRSRCQIVSFTPLEDSLIQKQLEQRGIKPSNAKIVAELCDGSLGTALRWIEDELLEPAQRLAARIDEMVEGKPTADLSDFLKSAAEAQAAKALEKDELASKDAAVRGSLDELLGIAVRRLRGQLASQKDPQILENICQAIDAIARAGKYLDANVNVSLTLEQLGLSFAAVA